jgi:DNA-binding GntR family transcriptional regulator
MAESELINRQTTASQVAEVLREKILRGELPGGQYVRQEAIAQQLGVSRLPVREALMLLESQGLVQNVKYKGALVVSLSAHEIEEVYALRALLERFLLEHAFEHLDENILDRAEAIIDRSWRTRSIEEWADLNWQFHKTLYEPANLELTLKTLEQVLARADRYFRLQRNLSAKLKASNDEQHRQVLALVRQGKRAEAVAAMTSHIAWNREDMRKTIQFLKSALPVSLG